MGLPARVVDVDVVTAAASAHVARSAGPPPPACMCVGCGVERDGGRAARRQRAIELNQTLPRLGVRHCHGVLLRGRGRARC